MIQCFLLILTPLWRYYISSLGMGNRSRVTACAVDRRASIFESALSLPVLKCRIPVISTSRLQHILHGYSHKINVVQVRLLQMPIKKQLFSVLKDLFFFFWSTDSYVFQDLPSFPSTVQKMEWKVTLQFLKQQLHLLLKFSLFFRCVLSFSVSQLNTFFLLNYIN